MQAVPGMEAMFGGQKLDDNAQKAAYVILSLENNNN
jgi:hypothetical protein